MYLHVLSVLLTDICSSCALYVHPRTKQCSWFISREGSRLFAQAHHIAVMFVPRSRNHHCIIVVYIIVRYTPARYSSRNAHAKCATNMLIITFTRFLRYIIIIRRNIIIRRKTGAPQSECLDI